jgi:hypothetical protein
MSKTISGAPGARVMLLLVVALLAGACGGTVRDEMLAYQGLMVRVQEIEWNTRLGHQSSGDGHTYLSLLLVGVNTGQQRRSFNPLDFRLVDDNGHRYGAVLVAGKEPRFLVCSVSPGDECTGWWTTRLPADLQGLQGLYLQWQPNWPGSPRFHASLAALRAAYHSATATPPRARTPTPVPITTPIPTKTPTRTPQPTTVRATAHPPSGGECGLGVGDAVQVKSNARTWSKPTVVGSKAGALLPPGETVYMISGPEWGRIRADLNSSGWWWQVSASPDGPALGWIWEGRIAGCN